MLDIMARICYDIKKGNRKAKRLALDWVVNNRFLSQGGYFLFTENLSNMNFAIFAKLAKNM
ncbi:MAG: hypothetical protein FWE44_06250 [Defluviitaleaceae bacterium]|nr:hypothetical protein [Defluviitaleaceae bacterium]